MTTITRKRSLRLAIIHDLFEPDARRVPVPMKTVSYRLDKTSGPPTLHPSMLAYITQATPATVKAIKDLHEREEAACALYFDFLLAVYAADRERARQAKAALKKPAPGGFLTHEQMDAFAKTYGVSRSYMDATLVPIERFVADRVLEHRVERADLKRRAQEEIAKIQDAILSKRLAAQADCKKMAQVASRLADLAVERESEAEAELSSLLNGLDIDLLDQAR